MDAQVEAQNRRSRGRPRSDKAERIESEILQGALKLFLRNGYGGTSITRIVNALGISKTTLYARYASKAELFHAIMSEQTRGWSAQSVFQSGGVSLHLEAGLLAFAIRALEASLEGDLLHISRQIYSESRRFPELGQAAVERTEFGIRQVAEFIAQRALQDGVPCRDPAGVARVFVFTLRGWYVNVMLANQQVGKPAISQFCELTARLLVAGREHW